MFRNGAKKDVKSQVKKKWHIRIVPCFVSGYFNLLYFFFIPILHPSFCPSCNPSSAARTKYPFLSPSLSPSLSFQPNRRSCRLFKNQRKKKRKPDSTRGRGRTDLIIHHDISPSVTTQLATRPLLQGIISIRFSLLKCHDENNHKSGRAKAYSVIQTINSILFSFSVFDVIGSFAMCLDAL